MRRTKILMVDSEENRSKAALKQLRLDGYQVITAANGIVAVKLAVSESPDLLVLDINLPDLDGFEVARRLNLIEETLGLPVILLTTKNGDKARVFDNHAGAINYLAKPYQYSELLSTVIKSTKISGITRSSLAYLSR